MLVDLTGDRLTHGRLGGRITKTVRDGKHRAAAGMKAMSEYGRDRQVSGCGLAASGQGVSPTPGPAPSKAFLVAMAAVGSLLTLFVLWVAYRIWLA